MKKNYYIVGLIFLTFYVISFVTNILGALNPEVIKNFNLSLTLSAFLPFAFFAAYGIMSIPAGILVERYKEKKIMTASFLLSFFGAMLFYILPKYEVFLLSLFLIGSGMAMLQVLINPLLRVAGGEKSFAFNSVLAQLIFGGASFIAPLFLSYLIITLNSDKTNILKSILKGFMPGGSSWISLYWVFALIFLIMLVVAFFSKFPQVERNEDEKAGSWQTHIALFKQKTVILYFIGIFCYVGTEQGVSYWISKFLYNYHNIDPLTTGAAAVGWFWGMLSIGCFAGLFLLKLFDSRKILIAAVLSAYVFLSLALFGTGQIALYSFPMIGFSLSVMWSIIFSLALNSVENHHGSFAGILCTAIIGGAIVQIFVGWLGDLFGLRAGMLLVYCTLAYVFSIGFWAKPLINNETISFKKKDKKENIAADN